MNLPTSDITVITKPKKTHRTFSTQYIEKIFRIWYEKGKPGSTSLLPLLSADMDEYGRIPNKSAIVQWITDIFKPRAELLDQQIKDQLDALVVSEKIEMLKRHAKVGLQMQDMAIIYLNENREELSAPAAVRLLVEGIRIERESRGIPAALDKIRDMSDEKLMEQIKDIVTSSGVTLGDIDANS